MTFGAVVLDWVQPTYHAQQKQSRQLVALLKKAIDQPTASSTVQNRWQSIQILPQSPDLGIKTNNSHFLIDRKGKISATENWRVQQNTGSVGVLRIGLLASVNTNAMTESQWLTAHKLLNGLQQLCEIPSHRIFWEDTLALPPSEAGFSLTQRPNPQISPLAK
ncbi:MAG: hypothetical protein JSV03_10850 [Planctomycetota bacterium]|nr:MAG: hypothetical protein JSV03_10850 [Planctomycetota bacterium]